MFFLLKQKKYKSKNNLLKKGNSIRLAPSAIKAALKLKARQ